MKKRIAVLIAPISVVVAMLVVSPVFARDGTSGGSGSNDSNETSTSSGSGSNTTASAPEVEKPEAEQKVEIEHEVESSSKQKTKHEVENESDDVLKDLLKDHKEHSAEERKKNCQEAEKGLETKLANLSKNATAFQSRIDSVLAKAISYQKDNNITVANFDQLVATAKTAQVQSASSVSVLNSLNTNLDCSQTTVAKNVAQFKVAAKKARDDLKTYKDSVKAILVALENAKEKQ